MNTEQPAKIPNYADVIREVLSHVNGPISTEDLAAQILQKRPSNAKNPHHAALTKIREEVGRQLVYLDDSHVLPLRLAYQDARYRLRLTKEIIDEAALPLSKCFRDYLPSWFHLENISFVDSQGNPVPSKVLEVPRKLTFSPGEKVEFQEPVVVLKEWFRTQKMYHKDHILVTIVDWEQGVFRLERERFGEQRPDLITERNGYIADALYALLEKAQDVDIYVHVALPTVYARMTDKDGYPPDHWTVVVNNDPRIVSNGWLIHYSDSGFSPIEMMYAEATGQSLLAEPEPFSIEEAKQVYHFRAQLTHQPSIWREIEIIGKQTLEDLDDILRRAFMHDTSDHLSGFWKRVARGGGYRKRYREVELATVNPFEDGEGSDTPIAALKLRVGDQLKYVYDFGDWIEHILKLQSIGEHEKGIRYPRETGRNKPKYQNCIECQEESKQTIATWICYTCSDEEQRDYLLCEQCLEKHEDHYVEEIIY